MKFSQALAVLSHTALLQRASAAAVQWNGHRGRDGLDHDSSSTSLPPTLSAPFSNTTTSGESWSLHSSSTADASSSQSVTTASSSQYSTTSPVPTSVSITGLPTSTDDQATESTASSSSTISCTPFPTTGRPTFYDVVFTSTTTLLENQTDYQPPYDPIEIPTYCMTPPLMFPGPDDPPAIALPPEVTRSSAIPEVPTTPALPPFTFVTTDKNPSVVIVSSEGPPQYGQSGDVQPTFVVTASGQDVIINLSTFVGLSSGLTTTVTVDGGTFTISPTAVVGQGGSVPRPPPAPGGGGGLVTPPPPLETKTESETGTGGQDVIVNNHVQQPTNVVVAGAQLLTAIGPSIVVIHSTTITYGPSVPETSAVVGDETVSIGPSEVVVHGVTLGGTSLAPTSTEYEVVGGVTITQIGTGVIVIDHTTYTGDDDEPLTTSLHGELITIGPDQVVVANHTFSGAPPTYDSVVVSTIQPTGTGAEETGGGQSSDNSGDDEEDDAASLHGPHSGSLLLSVAIGIMVSM